MSPTRVVNGRVVERVGNQDVVLVNGEVAEVIEVLTPQQRQAKQAANREAYNEAQAEQERKKQEAFDHLRQEREQRAEQAAQAAAELEERHAPWRSERDRLAELVKRAEVQNLNAEARAVASPLDVGLATDAIGAERCLERLQKRLEEHAAQEPV